MHRGNIFNNVYLNILVAKVICKYVVHFMLSSRADSQLGNNVVC
jgi:hypothetical protein